ncbi:hypothetical protein [Aeromicrobium sp. UC242_57]|uniref:hypothetical protein n=1 Tax=Aeromicrobium sp. UC242_57 TaxID=3374624 RepID=UPI00378B384C
MSSAGRDEKVGRTAEAVAADQRQLEQDVGGILSGQPVETGALVDEIHVDPVGHSVDVIEEGPQCWWSVFDALDAETSALGGTGAS